nr:hypothetical protein [Ciceribacter sp. L1K22]
MRNNPQHRRKRIQSEETHHEPDSHRKELDQLPSYHVRAGQPVEPGPVGYRHHPLRHPQHRFPLLPLIGSRQRGYSKRHRKVPFLIRRPAKRAVTINRRLAWPNRRDNQPP